MIRLVGLFNPVVRELDETLYQFQRPFVSDGSKFQAEFGPFEPTPHPEAVRRTVAVPTAVRRLNDLGGDRRPSPVDGLRPRSSCLIGDSAG